MTQSSDHESLGHDGATAEERGSAAVVSSIPMVRLQGIHKTYYGQPAPAVENLNLDIMEGEIFALLGPSGCGKTTTLRMVAGLEDPEQGSIYFSGKPIVVCSKNFYLPPEKRQVGMVFQSYAIWPHMTVFENVAYPLKLRRMSRADIEERVKRVLEIVGMEYFAERSAMQLSGGQQQRVALARALVYQPGLLLLDEPFSNLDTKLRDQMRYEVKMLQSKLKITVLFVTHDQLEALSLSTRLAVMDHGRVQQVGTPRELYEHPVNDFVRDFLGKAIVFKGTASAIGRNSATLELNGGSGEITINPNPFTEETSPGRAVIASLRPEDIDIVSMKHLNAGAPSLLAVVEAAAFVGERMEYRISVQGQSGVVIFGSRRNSFQEGETVRLLLPSGDSGLWMVRPG